MTDRVPALTTWWGRLDTAGWDQLAAIARDGGSYLPGDLFDGLVDAGVLAVTAEQRRGVVAGHQTFPIAADILAYVLAHSN